MFDVAIVGGGPAGSSCAAFCAAAGLRVALLERENFPREKVCGDCINPACWPILRRLEVAEGVRGLPHGKLDRVEFIGIGGRRLSVELPVGDDAEIAIKRSLFDQLLLDRARELGSDGFRIRNRDGAFFAGSADRALEDLNRRSNLQGAHAGRRRWP